MTHSLHLANVRPMGGPRVDLLVRDGRIAALGAGIAAPPGVESIDGGGALLLPGLVEAHTHLDKNLLGMSWYRNEVGPRLIDKIENERRQKKILGIDPARQSARQVALSVAKGSTHIRSHVDVDADVGLAGIEGVMATRERFAESCDIQIVAFPQSGILVHRGARELMEDAMNLGCDAVGGLDPCAIDRDPKGHLEIVFGLAERFGAGVDIHLHEPGEMGGFSIELIVERTKALGLQGRVVISHAFCLGMDDRDYVARLVDLLAEARVAVMTHGAPYRPVPSVAQLAKAGVVVCCGSDGIRDTWGPYGNADMLERAMILGLRNNFRRDDEVELALDVVTRGGAAAMGLEGYGLGVGDFADLVLLDAEAPAEAVAARPPRKLVVKRGRPVARDGQCLIAAP